MSTGQLLHKILTTDLVWRPINACVLLDPLLHAGFHQLYLHGCAQQPRHSWNTSPSTAFGSRAPALRSPPSPLMRQPMSPPRSRGNAAASTSYHSPPGRQHTPTVHPGSPTYLPRQLAAYPAQQPAPLNAAMMGMQGAMHRPHMPSYGSPAASPSSRPFAGMAGGSGGSRGSPGMPVGGVSSFPELAALEADFLQHMNSITTGQGPVGQGEALAAMLYVVVSLLSCRNLLPVDMGGLVVACLHALRCGRPC